MGAEQSGIPLPGGPLSSPTPMPTALSASEHDHQQQQQQQKKIRVDPHQSSPRRRMSPANSNDSMDDCLSQCSGDTTHSVAERSRTSSGNNWGWFDETNSSGGGSGGGDSGVLQSLYNSLSSPGTDPPVYVLESPLPTQILWHSTSGRRPPQPERERKYFETLWAQNMSESEVDKERYTSPLPHEIDIPEKDFEGEILYRGKCPFSNAVSKSFLIEGRRFGGRGTVVGGGEDSGPWNSLTLQLPRFRIVQPQYPESSLTAIGGCRSDLEVHAEFLVVVSLRGAQNGMVSFGVWRRHRHFEQLAKEIGSPELLFANSLLSWQCVLNRKRWFRCLDHQYIALKAFLLERFLQDVLFESQNAGLLKAFLGLDV